MRREGESEPHDYRFDPDKKVWFWHDLLGDRREAECPEGFSYDDEGATRPKRGHHSDQVTVTPGGGEVETPERRAKKTTAAEGGS